MSENSLTLQDADTKSKRLTRFCKKFMEMELEDLRSGALWRAVVAEFVGCILLVYFTVGSAIGSPDEHPATLVEISLAAGFFFVAIITALGAVSGGHVNPAVTIGLLVAGHCSFVRFFFYLIAQCAGAIAGAALLKAVTPASKIGNLGLILPAKDVTSEQALMSEFIITFFLLFCVIAMIDKGRPDRSTISLPLVTGLIVCVNVFYAASVSGGCMNPVRNLGPAVITGNMDRHWIYWVGPMIGGAAGSLLYHRVFSTDMSTTDLRRACLSRGSYTVVVRDENNVAEAQELLEEKPLSKKSSRVELVEREACV